MFSSARVDAEPKASTTPPSTRTTGSSLLQVGGRDWLARLFDSSSQWKNSLLRGSLGGRNGCHRISNFRWRTQGIHPYGLLRWRRLPHCGSPQRQVPPHRSIRRGFRRSLPLDSSGKLGEPTVTEHEGGSKVVERRQESPHPHWTGFSPDGKYALYPTSVSTKS